MKVFENISEWIGRAISWLTLATVLIMTLVVILRYGFNVGWIAMQESTIYLHAFVLMLGMPYVLKHDKHVRVDIFYRRMRRQQQVLINRSGHLLFLIPVCVFILVMSWGYVLQSWQILEGSQEAGGLPLLFLLKSLLVVMPVLLILQALAEVFAKPELETLTDSQNEKEAN